MHSGRRNVHSHVQEIRYYINSDWVGGRYGIIVPEGLDNARGEAEGIILPEGTIIPYLPTNQSLYILSHRELLDLNAS